MKQKHGPRLIVPFCDPLNELCPSKPSSEVMSGYSVSAINTGHLANWRAGHVSSMASAKTLPDPIRRKSSVMTKWVMRLISLRLRVSGLMIVRPGCDVDAYPVAARSLLVVSQHPDIWHSEPAGKIMTHVVGVCAAAHTDRRCAASCIASTRPLAMGSRR
jgi:hypothetical protein